MPSTEAPSYVVAVTGAGGRIAYSLIPLLCDGSIFGKNARIHLRLIDIDSAMGRLEGLKMEIQDSDYELLDSVWYGTDAQAGFAGANVAVLLGKKYSQCYAECMI
jgi:lactate/malate dehydrogenase, NAD binding domain